MNVDTNFFLENIHNRHVCFKKISIFFDGHLKKIWTPSDPPTETGGPALPSPPPPPPRFSVGKNSEYLPFLLAPLASKNSEINEISWKRRKVAEKIRGTLGLYLFFFGGGGEGGEIGIATCSMSY